MRDFEKDGQHYRFEGHEQRTAGPRLHFSSRCAICAKRINFYPASFENAIATPIRRCYRHRMGGAKVGSRAEAVAIASAGWRVAQGSLLEEMRREGRAWTANVETFPPSGVAPKPVKKRDAGFSGNMHFLARSLADRGPQNAVDAAEGSEMSVDYARVLASRMTVRGWLVRVRHGVYDLTEAGRAKLGAGHAEHPMGLFD